MNFPAGAEVGAASAEIRLRDGALQLGLALSDGQIAQLLAYLALLQKWNRVYNLTSIRDPAQMLDLHLMDCLAVVAPLQRQLQGRAARLLDVGSGAGLPGAVFAICLPELSIDCVDAVAKKAAFIRQVSAQLQLPSLKGLHGRVEKLVGPYDVISSRAFSSLPDLVAWSIQAMGEGGVWLAMKGKQPQDEIAALPVDVEVFHVEQLRVPGLDAERCAVWLRKSAAVPKAC